MGWLKPSLPALHPQTILTFSGWAAVLLRSPNPGEEPQGLRSLLENVTGFPPLAWLEAGVEAGIYRLGFLGMCLI